MPAGYPRLLTDRDVVVIRNGLHEATRLRAWLDGHDGPMPSYRIELVAVWVTARARTPQRLLTSSKRWSGFAGS
jgi:hypothetical protein